jgi:hypothetical protein
MRMHAVTRTGPAKAASATLVAAPSRDWAHRHPLLAWRYLLARYPALRYAQIIPIALVLWGSDAVDKFRAGAAAAGLHNAVTVNAISREIGGGLATQLNDWLTAHQAAAVAAAWYYIIVQGLVTGLVGVVLIWRRVPSFRLHRNALIACNLIGLATFWSYPVAPPRMLAGYHDVTATAVPAFSSVLENKAAGKFAALPSLHVVWALWVAVALCVLLRKPALRAVVWLYPAATITDVIATGNHYWLDAITAFGVLGLGYAAAYEFDRAAPHVTALTRLVRPTHQFRTRWRL